jgi:thiosulfate/3-mercaptopyruvate sulfurtransferase
VAYDDVSIERDGIDAELPPVQQLAATFEKVGISDDSHVVIYAHDGRMGPMASRVFLALDHIGHDRVSLLNGGIARWTAEGRELSAEEPVIARGRLTPRPRPVTVDAKWVNARAGKPGVAFIDTRTTPEYLGAGTRGGLPSTGHVAGARQLEWEQLFSDVRAGVFLDLPAISRLFKDRVAAGDTVVTYCLVGYRASMTYFAARMLGYPTRLYDGSYQEWAKLGLPVKKGEAP